MPTRSMDGQLIKLANDYFKTLRHVEIIIRNSTNKNSSWDDKYVDEIFPTCKLLTASPVS